MALVAAVTACGSAPLQAPAAPAPVAPPDAGVDRADRPQTPEGAWAARARAAEAANTARLGEVRQSGTRLWWLRCPVEQKWKGGKCTGKARVIARLYALGACPRGYRLPTVAEYLLLLGECDRQAGRVESGNCRSCSRSPACSAMFGADEGWYWSTDAFIAHAAAQGGWSASFGYGWIRFVGDDEPVELKVRCLREDPR